MSRRRSGKTPGLAAKRLGFEPLETRVVLSSTGLTDPVASCDDIVTVAALEEEEVPAEAVLDIDIPSLTYNRFHELTVLQIPLLSSAQIASIPNTGWFATLTPLQRAALTKPQVQSLNTADVRITLLVEPGLFNRIEWLTDDQVQDLKYYDFYLLHPDQVPLLLPEQIATVVNDDWTFEGEMSDAAAARLTEPQVKALQINGTKVRIDWLTPAQRLWLEPEQIDDVTYHDWYLLTPEQITQLSPEQIQGVTESDWIFRGTEATWLANKQLSPAARAAFTEEQIPHFQISGTKIRIDWMSDEQAPWLQASQIHNVIYQDWYRLTPAQIPELLPEQIRTVTESDWIFRGAESTWLANKQLSPAARAALTEIQVQNLQISGTKVRIDWLDRNAQGIWLTPAQIAAVIIQDLRFLPTSKVPEITIGQIAAIIERGIYSMWPQENIHALTQEQVQAIRIPEISISILSSQQRGWLSMEQIHALPVEELHHLNADEVPLLSMEQIELITTPGNLFLWPDANVHALTDAQVQRLKVQTVHITRLSEEQVSWLSSVQIGTLVTNDLPRLKPGQIPHITPAQFAAMNDLFVIEPWSDQVKASLAREQLMALKPQVLAAFMNVEPVMLPPISNPGHDHSFAQQVARLVRDADATHKALATANGDWSDPAVWENGAVPDANARVIIPEGATIRFDVVMTEMIKTLRIDGTLTFATDVDTELRIDTMNVTATGALHIGTVENPIEDDVTARVFIPNLGTLDTVWDPYLHSRGLVSNGQIRMHGRVVTPYATLAIDPMIGHTTLQLTAAPVGWRVGDELVISGVDHIKDDFGAERANILAIDGTTITLDRPLHYDHDAPDGYGFSIQVANTNRNIQFTAEVDLPLSKAIERPQMVFFANPDVRVENILVRGFGRTNKGTALSDPVVIGGVLQPNTGLNPRARYALHFHHTGIDPTVAPGILRGNVVDSAAGWGYVNHQSNVIMEDNVAIGILGAGFVAEDGNEIGVMRRNLSISSYGSGTFLVLSRMDNHDWGHGGHGFWLQSPGVEVTDNISAGARGGAFAYMTGSAKALFDSRNLLDPVLAGGHDAVPIGIVPLRPFRNNTAYAAGVGVEVWFHQTNLNHGESVIEDFKAWNIRTFGIWLPYASRITIKNAMLVGRLDAVEGFAGYGVLANRLTHDIKFENIDIEGFEVGMFAPPRGTTIIQGGRFKNVQNIIFPKGHDTLHKVTVTEPITFIPVTPAQAGNRETFDFATTLEMVPGDNQDREIDSFFSFSDISIKLADGSVAHLYFEEQGADQIPFPTAPGFGLPDFSTDYVGKTNGEMFQSHGVWFNGGDLPAEASTRTGFRSPVVIENPSTPTHNGDFDGNGVVDGADLLIWQRNFGIAAPLATKRMGDADNDQDVDLNDLNVWKFTHGNTIQTSVAAAAPFSIAEAGPLADSLRDADGLIGAAMLLSAGSERLDDQNLLQEPSPDSSQPSRRPHYRPQPPVQMVDDDSATFVIDQRSTKALPQDLAFAESDPLEWRRGL